MIYPMNDITVPAVMAIIDAEVLTYPNRNSYVRKHEALNPFVGRLGVEHAQSFVMALRGRFIGYTPITRVPVDDQWVPMAEEAATAVRTLTAHRAIQLDKGLNQKGPADDFFRWMYTTGNTVVWDIPKYRQEDILANLLFNTPLRPLPVVDSESFYKDHKYLRGEGLFNLAEFRTKLASHNTLSGWEIKSGTETVKLLADFPIIKAVDFDFDIAYEQQQALLMIYFSYFQRVLTPTEMAAFKASQWPLRLEVLVSAVFGGWYYWCNRMAVTGKL